jgi:hypothetical protein
LGRREIEFVETLKTRSNGRRRRRMRGLPGGGFAVVAARSGRFAATTARSGDP